MVFWACWRSSREELYPNGNMAGFLLHQINLLQAFHVFAADHNLMLCRSCAMLDGCAANNCAFTQTVPLHGIPVNSWLEIVIWLIIDCKVIFTVSRPPDLGTTAICRAISILSSTMLTCFDLVSKSVGVFHSVFVSLKVMVAPEDMEWCVDFLGFRSWLWGFLNDQCLHGLGGLF